MTLVPFLYRKTAKQLKDDGDDGSGSKLRQESRLFFAFFGAPAIPVGLFWMGWTDYVSSSGTLMVMGLEPANIPGKGIGVDLVPDCRFSRRWIWHHLHLHVSLHVHHRLLPAVRSVGAYLCGARPVPCCRRHDRRGFSDVQEPRPSLDVDGAGSNQCCGDADSLHSKSLGTESSEAKQVGRGFRELIAGPF